MDRMSAIARAVLYEGYILWPYRRSALKNRQRWTFGALFPKEWSAEHPDDASLLRSQVLVEGGPDTSVSAAVRFLQVVERRVRDADGHAVDQLDVGDERHLAWEEATERELALRELSLGELEAGERLELSIGAGTAEEKLDGGAGALVRSWETLEARAQVSCEPLERGLHRLTLELRNATGWQGNERGEALRHALVSTHVAWETSGGAFVSLADPPDHLAQHARACNNVGTWPVLAGEEGDRSKLLSSPIILEDHPRIAPESPGDMFDGGEIDQLLILNILGMTEAEKREMAASDPRARDILERCSALGAEDLMSLHGTIREFRPVSGP
jgi:hypothetical protein